MSLKKFSKEIHSKSARVLMKYFVAQWLWGRVATHQIEVSKPLKNDSKGMQYFKLPGIPTSFSENLKSA